MSAIAGDPPLYSACLDAADNYALWGYHIALMKALVRGDTASVAVLVQAGLQWRR